MSARCRCDDPRLKQEGNEDGEEDEFGIGRGELVERTARRRAGAPRQPMGAFRDCLEGVGFTLRYDGREMSPAEAEGLREGCAAEDETDAVTPDPIVTCPKCHKRFRVGRAMA